MLDRSYNKIFLDTCKIEIKGPALILTNKNFFLYLNFV